MEYIRINHSVNYVRLSDYLNDQGGKANVEVSSRIFDDFINFPITFTRTPIVTATNMAETLDRDEWATSAISVINLTKFKYQTAQNGVSKLQWIAIGK